MNRQTLAELLPEQGDTFPRRSSIEIISGKTLAKTGSWHKAIVLAKTGDRMQLRLYGWQKNKDGEWRVRQKFNISKRYAAKVSEILDAFATEGAK